MTTLAADVFVRWEGSHWWALGVVALACGILLLSGHLYRNQRHRICRILAGIIAVEFVWEHIRNAICMPHEEWMQNLPLHFCSAMGVVSFIALWKEKRWACAFTYFGVLSASIQALITPALHADFPNIRYFIFFTSHGLLLLAALAIPCILKWRARPKDIIRTLLIADAYILCIIPINLLLGTNYGFTQHGPEGGSLLDLLGPGPWYYLYLQIPALLLFALMYLPVRAKTQHAEKA